MSKQTGESDVVRDSRVRRAVTAFGGRRADPEVVAALGAAFIALAVGILRVFGITSGWLIAVLVVIGASYSLVGQVLRHRPRPFVLALAATAVIVVVFVGVMFESADRVLPSVQQSSARALAPSNDAPCSVLQAAVTRLPEDSPPELGGGNILVAKVVPNGDYSRIVRVRRGDVVQFSLRLHNTSYSEAEDVSASVLMPATSSSCWKASGLLTWRMPAYYQPVESSPVFIVGRSTDQLQLQPLRGTTILYNAADREVAKLADGITSGKLPLPYAVETGVKGTLFINFQVRVL